MDSFISQEGDGFHTTLSLEGKEGQVINLFKLMIVLKFVCCTCKLSACLVIEVDNRIWVLGGHLLDRHAMLNGKRAVVRASRQSRVHATPKGLVESCRVRLC